MSTETNVVPQRAGTPSSICCTTPTVTQRRRSTSNSIDYFLNLTPNLSTNGENAVIGRDVGGNSPHPSRSTRHRGPRKSTLSNPPTQHSSTPRPSAIRRSTTIPPATLKPTPSPEPFLDSYPTTPIATAAPSFNATLLYTAQDYIISAPTLEVQQYHEDRCHEYQIMEAEGYEHGFFRQEDSVICGKDCAICKIWRMTQLMTTSKAARSSRQLHLSYEPDRHWLLSEVAKLMVYFHLPDIYEARSLIEECQRQAFHHGATLFFFAGTAAFESIAAKGVWEQHDALDLVGRAILSGELAEAEYFLQTVMQKSSQDLFNADLLNPAGTVLADGPSDMDTILLHRRAASQLHIIHWFDAHRHIVTLGAESSGPAFFTTCQGIQIGNVHFCLSGRCISSIESPSAGEDFNGYEDEWIAPEFESLDELRLRIWQGFWRCLKEFGESFFAA